MRVLQLIDSLRPGGAERMALNLTNSLSRHIEYSGICVTREKGSLTGQLDPQTGYLFLKKESAIDVRALINLYRFIKRNKINIVHAHGTSFFTGSIIKIFTPHLKLIWHDHLGGRINKKRSAYPTLYLCSILFDGVLTVNKELAEWVRKNLRTKKTAYIPNFLVSKFIENFNKKDKECNSDILKIICLANLKNPKNHLNILRAFKIVNEKFPEVELLLVGKKYHDDYQKSLEQYIRENKLQKKIFLTGEKPEGIIYLMESCIGVISSDSEGLPMALLEYGAAKLAVVSTNVGACPEVIGNDGQLVETDNSDALAKAILFYLEDEEARMRDAKNFNDKILSSYSQEIVLPQIINFYYQIQ